MMENCKWCGEERIADTTVCAWCYLLQGTWNDKAFEDRVIKIATYILLVRDRELLRNLHLAIKSLGKD
jgi:hypothetical protein